MFETGITNIISEHCKIMEVFDNQMMINQVQISTVYP